MSLDLKIKRHCFVFTSFIIDGTGTALSDDNRRALDTTAPWKNITTPVWKALSVLVRGA